MYLLSLGNCLQDNIVLFCPLVGVSSHSFLIRFVNMWIYIRWSQTHTGHLRVLLRCWVDVCCVRLCVL